MPTKKLNEMLSALSGQDILPMHMPGHKRNFAEFPWLAAPCGGCDITEIAGADDLYAPEGVLKGLLDSLARLWGSRRAFLSVNGSTGAVFAALSLVREKGLLAARNCHRSVFAAARELGVRTECVLPPLAVTGFFGSVRAEDVARELDKTGCGAVIITSPTYDGVLSDIPAIARAAHERGAILIVDGAHGAHLGLSDAFPDGGVREGADVVISSLHKTLPALTQTAVLHVCSDRVSEDAAASAIAAFCTSSPSYLLMSSVESMADYLSEKGAERERELARMLARFRSSTTDLRHLRVLDGERDKDAAIFKTDASKIYIDCTKCDLSGYALKKTLREEFGIELESASDAGALAYATVGDTEAGFLRLDRALHAVDERCGAGERKPALPAFGVRAEGFETRAGHACEKAELADAVGRVSAESVWVYPPGIPVLLPGETVTPAVADYLTRAASEGASVAGEAGHSGTKVFVVK